MHLKWTLVWHRAIQYVVHSLLHSLPLECVSCHLEYRQARDWLAALAYSGAIDRVEYVHNLVLD